jgi:N-acetylneuraminate synthase
MSTPYDLEAVHHLDPFVRRFKIGSGDITWLGIIEEVASTGKQILFATGASNMQDVMSAAEVLKASNNPSKHVVMQCNTNYTGSDENLFSINLNVIDTFKESFPELSVGLSDHTDGHLTVLGAIAKGATFIEKHFTDDRTRKGPDHGFSMDPSSWSLMMGESKLLAGALGSGVKEVEANEIETVVLQRRCLRIIGNLEPGHIITEADIEILRPAPKEAFLPSQLKSVIGKSLTRQTFHHQPVTQDLFT